MARSARISGLDRLRGRINGLQTAVRYEVNEALSAAAEELNADISRNITTVRADNGSGATDNGELLSAQQVEHDDGARRHIVFNSAPHAPFVEFGTGARFKVTPEWEDIAKQFKDEKSGSFDEFEAKIKEWLSRHGGDPNDSFIVCMSILNNGLYARPFFQPALGIAGPRIVREVRDIIRGAL